MASSVMVYKRFVSSSLGILYMKFILNKPKFTRFATYRCSVKNQIGFEPNYLGFSVNRPSPSFEGNIQTKKLQK